MGPSSDVPYVVKAPAPDATIVCRRASVTGSPPRRKATPWSDRPSSTAAIAIRAAVLGGVLTQGGAPRAAIPASRRATVASAPRPTGSGGGTPVRRRTCPLR